MKVRTDCQKCRERIYKEAEAAYLKHEYKFFSDNAYSFAAFTATVALSVLHKRGRSKKYIQEFYDDMCFIFDLPEVMGKQVRTSEMMQLLSKEYDIDFNKINLHLETEAEFIKDIKRK